MPEPSDAPHTPAADTPEAVTPPRASRQDLVVPPRHSLWPVAIGAVASAAAGFGLVLALGIGREPLPAGTAADHQPSEQFAAENVVADPAAAPPPSFAHDPAAMPLTPPAEPPTPRPAVSRWSTPEAPADEPTAMPAGSDDDRFPARPVSHDEAADPAAAPHDMPAADDQIDTQPDDSEPPAGLTTDIDVTAGDPTQPLSRFSSPDLPPLVEPPSAAPPVMEPDPTPALVEAAAVDATDDLPPANRPASDSAPADMAPTDLPAATAEPGDPVADPLLTDPPTDPVADEPAGLPADLPTDPTAAQSAELMPPAALDAAPPAAEAMPEPPLTPPPPAAATARQPAPLPATEDEQPVPAQPPAAPPAFVATPPAAWPVAVSRSASEAAPVAPPAAAAAEITATGSAAELPAAAPPLAGAATLPPFAAAPSVGLPPLPAASSPPSAPASPSANLPAADVAANGVPGPLQLEGVQTPQLAVEKRGPREIQVGKPARYEILVRNVGSATAHDVTLRDAVPRGTSLIATTPPASPDAEADSQAGGLIWTLGVLPPGGEARVLMELMPEEEGDIGSIASVSFRADATLRSRATKPALAIDAPSPDPIRIGQDLDVVLTISNPGSGTATGVVLEAFLPETVSHRAGGELEFDVGQLQPGESKTIELVLGTRGPGSLPARFTARADGGVEIDAEMPVTVTAPALALAIDMPARRFLQRPAACTISMNNAGTASARSVELAAQLPPGMKFVRANNAGWHDERTHRVLWNLEELPAGETGTVEVVVMPVEAGEQRITAAARSTDGPADQALHVCRVEGLAALAFQVADSEDPIEVEGVTEYVIRVANEGTAAASGVRLAAVLLGDLEPVEVTGPGGHRVENLAVDFEPLARLAPGEDVVYRIRARGHRAGDQRVQVQLVSEDHPTPITKEEVTRVYDDR
jgi:uncharacterized repeat protein (TIGR01451 family)